MDESVKNLLRLSSDRVNGMARKNFRSSTNFFNSINLIYSRSLAPQDLKILTANVHMDLQY